MNDYFVCTSPDFDNEILDVVLVLGGSKCYVKGFDDTDWKCATLFAEKLASRLNLEYVGELNLNE